MSKAVDLINRLQAANDDLKRDTIPKLEDSLKRANKYGLDTEKENQGLKAEIERLQKMVEDKGGFILMDFAKAEAVKEFAERLDRKFAFSSDTQCISAKTIRKFIQDELKEMVGEG